MPADFFFKTDCLRLVQLGRGKIMEAIRMLETGLHPKDSAGNTLRGILGCAYARAGRRRDAERLASTSTPLNQARTFACLGDKDRTLEALDRVTVMGPIRMGCEIASPEYAFVRGDSQLKAVRNKVGLPQ